MKSSMETAVYVAISVPLLVFLFMTFIVMFLTRPSQAAEAKAKARRLAEAKLNARLLRLNL